jgi:hypothetical protein
MTLLDCITAATGQGYKVEHRDDWDGWIVITPKRPRKPSEELGSHKTERTAWVAAAFLAQQ